MVRGLCHIIIIYSYSYIARLKTSARPPKINIHALTLILPPPPPPAAAPPHHPNPHTPCRCTPLIQRPPHSSSTSTSRSTGLVDLPLAPADPLVLSVPVSLLTFDAAVGRVPAAVVHRFLLAVITLESRGEQTRGLTHHRGGEEGGGTL